MKTTKSKADAPKKASENADVLQLLHADHQLVSELFYQFTDATTDGAKEKLVKQIIEQLRVHTQAEEEVVYSAVKEEIDEAEDLIDEADTEHHTIKFLLDELDDMSADDDLYEAKVTVLCELVKHHVREEEKEMFKKIRESDLDREELGAELASRKVQIMESKTPRIAKMTKKRKAS